MNVDGVDLDMGEDSLYGAGSSLASVAVQQWIDESLDYADHPFTSSMDYGLLPEATTSIIELTPQLPGEPAVQQHQTPPVTPRFDPASLLNPKSAPKRPAATSEGSVGSRSETASAGQVSLVERLHNVQERAASPAKRVKTGEQQQQQKKKSSNSSQFAGSNSLDLKNSKSGGAALPTQNYLDLTMSTYLLLCVLWYANDN